MQPGKVALVPESVLAASWIHAMLFFLEIVLAIRYFSQFKGSSRFNLLVVLIMSNATVTLLATFANTWKLLITHRLSPPTQHSWPLPVMIISKNIAATIEQSFLVYRYYGLSKSIFVSSFCVLAIAVHLASGLLTGIEALVHPSFTNPISIMAHTVSFSMGAVIDILIPVLLIWELRKIKTTYAHTQSFIHRIIVNAASSGSCVALAEIFSLTLYWAQYSVVLLGCAIVGPFYGITVLVNLFVCQRKVTPNTMPTKTGNLTTLDSVQIHGSFDPPHYRDHLTYGKETEGSGDRSTDCVTTSS